MPIVIGSAFNHDPSMQEVVDAMSITSSECETAYNTIGNYRFS